MSQPLPPQAALEAAVRDAVRAQLGYREEECERTRDGRPAPRCGLVYVAVWSDGRRESDQRMALDERLGVMVTVSLRSRLPLDHSVELRDDLESRLNAIRALVHRDCHDHAIRRAANLLAGLGDSGSGRSIGFCEALAFGGYDPVMEAAGEWFGGSGRDCGLYQTARFGRARLVQAIPSAR